MTVNKQVIEFLKESLAKNPKAFQLMLDFMHINDLMPYMDLLAQFKNLRNLSLYNNRLKQLPIDMSSLQNLQTLDISNNLFRDVDMVVVSLTTLPNLKVLKYPVKKQKESTVIDGLKKLTLFNDLHIIRQKAKKAMALRYMNEEKLLDFKHKMIEQYRKVEQLQLTYLKQKSSDDTQQKFVQEVDSIIYESMKKMGEKQGQMSESLQIIYFNKTTYQIFNIIKTRCINMAMDYYGQLGKVIKDIVQVQNKLFEGVLVQAIKMVHFEYQMKEIEREKMQNKFTNINYENKIFEKNEQMQKQIKRIKKQKDELIIEINQLQSQNKRYLESLVRFAKGDKSGFINLNQSTNNFMSRQTNSPALIPNQNVIKPLERIPRVSNNNTQIKDTMQMQSNYMTNGRNLTLKQLKETIQDIYEGKVKFDKKNFDGKIARQTMHQYLFTHLNQKYGLKNLTIQAASSIVGGIQTFSSEDNDVAVFGKILRNQIDEEFKDVQSELKQFVQHLLKMHNKNKMTYKSAIEIDNIVKQKINGEVTSQQVQDILKYCYDRTDSNRILHKIQLLYKMHKPRQQPSHRRMRDQSVSESSKKRIKFSTFLQAVLDFQMKNHERLIRPVVNVFKSKDRDGDGIVNEQEFIMVIEELCDDSSNLIEQFLMLVDPYDTKTITFSQVVRLVTNYPENNPILSRFVEKDEPVDDLQ